MEQIKEVFINWQVILIAFGSFALLGIIRAIGTKKDGDGKVIGGFAQHNWFKAFTPFYPYILAMGLVFAPGIPLPKVIVELGKRAILVKILYGLYAGWLSGYSFQVVKKFLENALNMKFDPELGDMLATVKPPEPPKPTEPVKPAESPKPEPTKP